MRPQLANEKPSGRNISQTPYGERHEESYRRQTLHFLAQAAKELHNTLNKRHGASRRNAAKTPRTKNASTLPSVAEIALRRKTRPTPLHLTAAKRRRIGARSPPTFGARSPPSHGARSPPALGARSPPSHGARSPPALGARSPPSHGARSPPALGARSPPSLEARSPPALGARPPPTFGVRPPPAAGGQPTLPLVTVDLTLSASSTSARNELPVPEVPLPRRKKNEARLLALFGASPPKSTTGQGTKKDRPITPDIDRSRSITPPIPWYPPPLISPLRRTPPKESIATQTSSIRIGIDAATQTKRRGGKARKLLFNNNNQTRNRNCDKENRHNCKWRK
ncbi:uncharacterized protein [Polyergus mexicanus]|uniref:uncharacterized protein n=1 Tax=Polyergus mexicanus TaxID=615972 RepID=UPI0038B589BE